MGQHYAVGLNANRRPVKVNAHKVKDPTNTSKTTYEFDGDLSQLTNVRYSTKGETTGSQKDGRKLGNAFEYYIQLELEEQLRAKQWGVVTNLSPPTAVTALTPKAQQEVQKRAKQIVAQLLKQWETTIENAQNKTVRLTDPNSIGNPIGDLLVELGDLQVIIEAKWQQANGTTLRDTGWIQAMSEHYFWQEGLYQQYLKDVHQWEYTEYPATWITQVKGVLSDFLDKRGIKGAALFDMLLHKGNLYADLQSIRESEYKKLAGTFLDGAKKVDFVKGGVSKIVLHGTRLGVQITDVRKLEDELKDGAKFDYQQEGSQVNIYKTGPGVSSYIGSFALLSMHRSARDSAGNSISLDAAKKINKSAKKAEDKAKYYYSPRDFTFTGRIAANYLANPLNFN